MSGFTAYHHVFEVLTSSISEGVLVVGKDQKILAVNQRLLEIFGYEREELEDHSFDLLIPTEARNRHQDYFKEFLIDGTKRRMASGRTLFGNHKSGKEIPLEIGLTPVTADGDHYIVALIMDVSERHRSEHTIRKLNKELEDTVKDRTEELQKTVSDLTLECERRELAEQKAREALSREKELNAIKTSFMQMVSHEFKTPLSGILTATMLIEKYRDSLQQDKRIKHLESIKRKVQHLDSLLNDFLAVERLGAGRESYRFSEFWLSDLLKELLSEATQALGAAQVIHPDLPDTPVRMYQDRVVLNLIISNVLNNAMKYSGPEGKIGFRAEILPDQGLIKIEISDTGLGIPEEEQQYIFSRYFRASNVKNLKGTGIGLNMAKKHLQNLGGHIFFRSNPEEGTLFTIMIPEKLQQ